MGSGELDARALRHALPERGHALVVRLDLGLGNARADRNLGDDRLVEELGIEPLCQQVADGNARRSELPRDGYDGHLLTRHLVRESSVVRPSS